ncbi:MAG: hypothetical protein PHP82_02995 [Candidatus ainarchaeum sp.]|nr:hypothetical protein [Candidatus ainarchaeum sp.]
MNKGQIFSLDFLLAMIIVIIFFGTIINSFETKTYLLKENINYDSLIQKSNSAFIALTNGKYVCKTNVNNNLPFTINKNLLPEQIFELKEYLGLQDKNILLILDEEILFEDKLLEKNEKIIVIEKDIVICDNEIDFVEFEKCLNGNPCEFEKKKIVLKVSE